MGGGSSTAEEAQGHSQIPRRGRKTGEMDRIGGEKKGESNPDEDASVNRLIDVLHVSSNHAKSILMTVYPATPPHPFTVREF